MKLLDFSTSPSLLNTWHFQTAIKDVMLKGRFLWYISAVPHVCKCYYIEYMVGFSQGEKYYIFPFQAILQFILLSSWTSVLLFVLLIISIAVEHTMLCHLPYAFSWSCMPWSLVFPWKASIFCFLCKSLVNFKVISSGPSGQLLIVCNFPCHRSLSC